MSRTSLSIRFGARVRAARSARGFSQADLATRVGLSPNHLGVLERGEKVPTLETVEAVAKALGVTAAELIADGSAGDAWFDELRAVGAGVPPPLRTLALDVLGAFAKRARAGRKPTGTR